jgi:voltage-gated potassium channel
MASEATSPLKDRIRHLYHGDGEGPRRFRLGLLGLDILTIIFFIGSSMLEPKSSLHIVDYPVALIIALDLAARTWISHERIKYLFHFHSLADILVIFSLLAPLFADNLAFLRVVRMLRLFRSYKLLSELRNYSKFFAKNEEIIHSSVNLLIFIFVVTAVVYVVEARQNPNINNYIDALYFTVTTLTTTGFGDITMTGTAGRLVAVIIMILGVALFLRLVQTIFRPHKVLYPCPDCGLKRHDADAVHCKHCGHILNIPNEGYN